MKQALIIIVVLAILGGGAFMLLKKKDTPTSTTNQTATPSNTQTETANQSEQSTKASEASNASNTLTYSDNGFSPASLTVKKGSTVTLKNTSSKTVQFDSDPHPVHTDNPELNQPTLAPGESQTFTVNTTGTFGFHNHLNPGDTGTIIVE